MNKALSLCCAALLAVAASAQAQVQISLSGGFLKNQNNVAIPSGSGLLVLVASTTDSIFAAPTSAAFASGDDVVLFKSSFGGDANGDGTPGAGEFALSVSATYANFVNLNAGDPLALYWYPTLTPASTAPGVTSYGSYRSGANADGSNNWVAPADGTIGYNLLFVTSDAGSSVNTGTSGIPFGQAAFMTVPEPSTYLVLFAGVACPLAMRMRPRFAPRS